MKKNQVIIQRKKNRNKWIAGIVGFCVLGVAIYVNIARASRNNQSDDVENISSVSVQTSETSDRIGMTSAAVSEKKSVPLMETSTGSVLPVETSLPSDAFGVLNAETSVDRSVKRDTMQKHLADLEKRLAEKVGDYPGDWSVYVKNLDTGETAEVDNHQMFAASLIKLYILATYLDETETGRVEQTEEGNIYLSKMISISDNDATNEVVKLIGHGDSDRGREIVNAFCMRNGYEYTSDNRDLGIPPELQHNAQNYTSVRDTGEILEAIYRGESVGTSINNQFMMDLLIAQERRWKIPAGIPDGIVVANKTGELTDTENDAAIVFSPNCDYILCVMVSELGDTKTAQSQIVEISKYIYEYFN